MTKIKANKISTCLWFDDQAEEAANFYTSLFNNSDIGTIARYGKEGHEIHGQPVGKVMTVEFNLAGQPFTALNGGPHFTFTPAISFFALCETEGEVDTLWDKFSEGGTALMELGAYDWSKKYGWVQDRYGLSWQVMQTDDDIQQKLIPSLMFVGDQADKAEEAIRFYTGIFENSKVGNIARYGAGREPDKEGTVMYADFNLLGQKFAAMDSAHDHAFSFNEAISFVVNCETQKKIDYYWGKLSAVPEAEQCGWVKDRYGVSWQVVPSFMSDVFKGEANEKSDRVMKAMLQMKKLDIKTLKQAYEQRLASTK